MSGLSKIGVFALFLCFFCINIFGRSEYQVSVTGFFPVEETINLVINSDEQNTISVKITPNLEKQIVYFSVPCEKSNIRTVNVRFQNGLKEDICIERIQVKNITNIAADDIAESFLEKYNYNIKYNICQHNDGINYCCLYKVNKHEDYIYLIFVIPELIRNSLPIGIQLFFRLSFLTTLLILIFVTCKQATSQQFSVFGITLLLAVLPFKIDYTNYVMVFMMLAILFSYICNKPRQFIWQPLFYVLCAIYLLNVIGLLYSGDINRGIKRLDSNIPLLAFPVFFSMIQFTKKNLILILRFFIWIVIAFCAFGLLSHITILPEFTWNLAFRDSKQYAPLLLMWPAHPHPSFVSTILLMAVPIALYLRFHDGKQISAIEMVVGVLLPVVFTFLVGARVGMLLIPILLGLGYLFYCRLKPLIKWGITAVGIVIVGLLLHQFPAADDRFVDPIRVDLRKTAISAIKEKPIFGWGTGYVTPLIHSEERSQTVGIETPYDLSSFHNQYLEDMVQFGIPGILILLTLFGWILYSGLHEKNYLILSILTIYVAFCWTETALTLSKGIVPFAFWLCFLMANLINMSSKTDNTLV